MSDIIKNIISDINNIPKHEIIGLISVVNGLLIEATGIAPFVSVGSKCKIINKSGEELYAEVIGLKEDKAMMMTYDVATNLGIGCKVCVISHDQAIYPSSSWIGRVLNSFGEPIDNKGPLVDGNIPYHLHNVPPRAHLRKRVGGKLDLGIRSINAFASCCHGQRLGIFSGSGVGKSMMISMMTKYSDADIKIIGLIGERGREVKEFLEEYLGEEGLKKAIVVVSTSDESPLRRKQAAYLTMTLCDYFRDHKFSVLCMMDSVTRFAMAQREIGLATGEPPTAKGYTPSVFAELPRLLERAGPGEDGEGDVTGFFSVLVEGDDHNEPIADAVRSILDGHIVLSRKIASLGIYPAVDVLSSVSRTMPKCNTPEENKIVDRARRLISQYSDMEDLIRIGAYKKGSDPKIDESIQYIDQINQFISQPYNEKTSLMNSYDMLKKAIGMEKDEK